MSDQEREAYLAWIRSTSNSQLACLFRNMMKQNVLMTGAALYVEKRAQREAEDKDRQSKLELERTALSKDEKVDLLLIRCGRILEKQGMDLPATLRSELTEAKETEEQRRRMVIKKKLLSPKGLEDAWYRAPFEIRRSLSAPIAPSGEAMALQG